MTQAEMKQCSSLSHIPEKIFFFLNKIKDQGGPAIFLWLISTFAFKLRANVDLRTIFHILCKYLALK